MTRIPSPTREELPEFAGLFEIYEQLLGFVPGTVLSMSRVPKLVEAYAGMAHAASMNGLISEELAQLIAGMTTAGSGCRYCQAHTAAHASRLGVESDKLSELWSFETSDHFDEAERAALRFAFHAGQQPNAVTDADFDACRAHYSDDQISAIVAVCALFGFLSRWNSTMATTLETSPLDLAEQVLAPQGWSGGKHVGSEA